MKSQNPRQAFVEANVALVNMWKCLGTIIQTNDHLKSIYCACGIRDLCTKASLERGGNEWMK